MSFTGTTPSTMPIPSTMQDDFALTIAGIIRHADALHRPVDVSVFNGTTVRHTSFAEVTDRARRLAGALQAKGFGPGSVIATFMWNTQAHLEAYLGVPAMGSVLHTINIRLFPEQVEFIVNDAADDVVLVDASLWDALAPVLPTVPTVRLVLVSAEGGVSEADLARMRAASAGIEVLDHEQFLDGAPRHPLDADDERAAALMCYTSGTTGHPKGVVYSHRSVYLHALVNLTAAGFGIGEADRLLQVVPLFHANGWGFPYAAWLGGASLVLPDRYLHPEQLTPLIASERPTVSGGVPTVWRGVFDHAAEHGLDLGSLRLISCAGSAVPESLIREYQGIGVGMLQAWGMTETSPLAAIARPPALPRDPVSGRERDEWYWRTRTGRPVPGVEVRAVAEDGTVLPTDGVSVGELQVRGPWVTGSYVKGRGADQFQDGWLATGDMGTVDDAGAMKITDRLKDLIKSGGEWISSTELEDIISGHPDVHEAAVIAVPDPKWEERPLVLLTLRPAAKVTREELRSLVGARLASWQVPSRWVVVDTILRTGVGKIDKQGLRARHAAGELPPDWA